MLHIIIQGHSIYVIETDGTILEPGPAIQVLRLDPAQRYSVIVKADRNPGNYWIRTVMDAYLYPIFGIMSYTNNESNKISVDNPLPTDYHLSDNILAYQW